MTQPITVGKTRYTVLRSVDQPTHPWDTRKRLLSEHRARYLISTEVGGAELILFAHLLRGWRWQSQPLPDCYLAHHGKEGLRLLDHQEWKDRSLLERVTSRAVRDVIVDYDLSGHVDHARALTQVLAAAGTGESGQLCFVDLSADRARDLAVSLMGPA